MHSPPPEADGALGLVLTPQATADADADALQAAAAGAAAPHNTPIRRSPSSSSVVAAGSVVGSIQQAAAAGGKGGVECTSPMRPAASQARTGSPAPRNVPAQAPLVSAFEPAASFVGSPARPAAPTPSRAVVVQSPFNGRRRFGAAQASPAVRSPYRSPLKALGLQPSRIVSFDPEAPLRPRQVRCGMTVRWRLARCLVVCAACHHCST